MPVRTKPANWKSMSDDEKAAWYNEVYDNKPSGESSSSSQPVASSSPVRRGLDNIRDWSEEKFNIPGERLRNCIIYQLDYAKNAWYRESGISIASMGRENFVRKLNADTPVGWTPGTDSSRKRIGSPFPYNFTAWLMLGPGVNAPVGGFTTWQDKLNAIRRSWYGLDWESQPVPEGEWEERFNEYRRILDAGV